MRNVIFAINISLDGCCDHTKQIGDEETHEYFTHLMREVDLLVFGRKTYQLMVPFWPEVAKPVYDKSIERICSNICLHQQNCFFTIIRQR